MLKLVAAGAAVALFVSASSFSFAQSSSPGMQGRSPGMQSPSPGMQGPSPRMQGMQERLGTADRDDVTSTRIAIIKSALQLTPDQEKHWPAIENAIRTRAEHRQIRIGRAAQALAQKTTGGMAEALRDRDPVEFMQKRAEALSERSDDLKKLADAWEPLYQTLKPDQKRRMALLSISVLRVMGNAVEQRRWEAEEDFDD